MLRANISEKSYCQQSKKRFDLESSNISKKFVDGSYDSMEVLSVCISTQRDGLLPLHVDAFEADILLLIGLHLLKMKQLLVNYLEEILKSLSFGWKMTIAYNFGNASSNFHQLIYSSRR